MVSAPAAFSNSSTQMNVNDQKGPVQGPRTATLVTEDNPSAAEWKELFGLIEQKRDLDAEQVNCATAWRTMSINCRSVFQHTCTLTAGHLLIKRSGCVPAGGFQNRMT